MANIEKITYKGDVYDISDAKAMHQDAAGSWMPDFDALKPIETHEWTIATTATGVICERANFTDINDARDVLAFRITVDASSGTSIHQVADVIVRLQPTANTTPLIMVINRSRSTSAATTGFRYLYTVYPKAANTNYKYQLAIYPYNSTSRKVKVEVFKKTDDWTFTDSRTAYSYNSDYQTRNDMTIYTSLGVICNYTQYMTTSYSNYAGYISSWLPYFNSSYSELTTGAAVSASQLCFIGEDGKAYPASNTTAAVDTAYPPFYASSAVSNATAMTWSYVRRFGVVTIPTSIGRDTLAAGKPVYMRCTNSNGKVYSANKITHDLTTGYTYVKIGRMHSATVTCFDTYNSQYFTVNNDRITRLNNIPLEAELAAAIDRQLYISQTGNYGVLLDNNQITDLTTPTMSPKVAGTLTFNPSTGILNATGFSGSGAGLTNIPSSGINYDELPLITDYTGPSENGRFATFLQNESDDPYTHPYLLEAPDAMTYRVGTNSIAFTNGVGLRRYKLGVYGARYSNTNDVSTFWCAHLKTPIEVDPSTHMPTNSLIVDGAKMTFRFYGDVTYADASSDYFDTYFTLCYQNQNGSGNWSVYYETRGDIHYGASITYHENHVTIVIGWAYNESTYNKQLQNFKAYRYVDMTLDHLGSTLGYAGGTSDYCKLIENRSGWTGLCWQGNASESWSDVLSQVYSNGRIEGTRGYSQDGELLPTKTLHVFYDSENDSYSFTDSLTDTEIADILEAAFEGEINLNVVLTDVDTTQVLKYYYPFNYVFLRVLMFELNPAAGINQTTWSNNALSSYFAIAFMPGNPPTFQFIAIEGANLATVAQQFMQMLDDKEDLSNKVTSISSSSTNDEYPSAKCVYDEISKCDNVLHGSCSSAASSATKVITLYGSQTADDVKPGTKLQVYFSNVNSMPSSGTMTLSIGNKSFVVWVMDKAANAVNSMAQVGPFFKYQRFLTFYISGDTPSRAYIIPNTDVYLKSPYQKEIRPTSMNVTTQAGAYLQYLCATNACNTGKPSINGSVTDAAVLHFNWDNSNLYSAQLAIQSGNATLHGMAYRNQDGTTENTWNPWKTLVDEDNIGSYLPTADPDTKGALKTVFKNGGSGVQLPLITHYNDSGITIQEYPSPNINSTCYGLAQTGGIGYTKIPDFTGATSSAAGATGLVPAPSSGDQNKFLRANGQWETILSSSISNDANDELLYFMATNGTDEYYLDKDSNNNAKIGQPVYNNACKTTYYLGGYTIGNNTRIFIAGGLLPIPSNSVNQYGGFLVKTPIALDQNGLPTSSLFTSGFEMMLRIHGCIFEDGGNSRDYDSILNLAYDHSTTSLKLSMRNAGKISARARIVNGNPDGDALLGIAFGDVINGDYTSHVFLKNASYITIHVDILGVNSGDFRASTYTDLTKLLMTNSNWSLSSFTNMNPFAEWIARYGSIVNVLDESTAMDRLEVSNVVSSTLYASGSLTVDGNADVFGDFYTEGGIEAEGNIYAPTMSTDSLSVDGSASIDGDLNVTRSITVSGNSLMDLFQDIDLTSGGRVTGDLVLYKVGASGAAPGDSYSLIFQRGTLTDNYNDWRVQDRGGFLYFDQRGSGSTSWANQVVFNTSGNVSATSFSGSGSSLTSLNASNISSGTLNSSRLPSIPEDKLPSTVEYCYTAALTPAGNGTIVFPIDGTKYRITQITLTNYDLNATAGFGMSHMFIANNGGTGGYMLGAIDYFSLASTSTDITMTIQAISSSGMQDSTNLHVQVRYVKL